MARKIVCLSFLFSLNENAIPYDVFQAIVKMKGKYLYRISVNFSDGDPVSGVVVNGLTPHFRLGETLRTNKDGISFSASDSASVIVSVSKYIGIKDGSTTVTATSADEINEGVLTP